MSAASVERAAPATPSARRRVMALALPAVGEQLLNTMVGLADVYLVGNLSAAAAERLGYGSATAIAAAGLGNQFIWLMMVVFMAMGVGATALVARAVGARDEEAARRVVRQAFLLAALMGAAVTVLALFVAEPFLALIGAPPETVEPSLAYIRINAAAFLPAVLLMVGTACLRGAGDTRTPLLLMLAINVTNVGVALLLVNGAMGLPALGVLGAALGAALGRGLGGIAVLALLLRGHAGLRLTLGGGSDWTTLRRLVNVGLPSAGEQMIFQGAMLIFVRFVNDLGTQAYAAHNIAITIESLSFLPGMGYAVATSALVGQALGARDPRAAEGYAYESLFQGALMMSLIGAAMVIFPRELVALFTSDPAVIDAAVAPLRAAGLVQPALAVSFTLLGAMRGAGDTRWPLLSRLLSTWGVRLPLTIIAVSWLGLGLPGVWLAMCSDFTVQAILALWRFSAGRWQQIEL